MKQESQFIGALRSTTSSCGISISPIAVVAVELITTTRPIAARGMAFIEFTEIIRSLPVIKSNINEVNSCFNTSMEKGVLKVLLHPEF